MKDILEISNVFLNWYFKFDGLLNSEEYILLFFNVWLEFLKIINFYIYRVMMLVEVVRFNMGLNCELKFK